VAGNKTEQEAVERMSKKEEKATAEDKQGKLRQMGTLKNEQFMP
jgi:hypothetical protein